MPIPEHVLDLAKPPMVRWEFLSQYRYKVKEVERIMMNDIVGESYMASAVEKITSNITKILAPRMAAYYDELKVMAKILEVDLGRLILMQLMYEACSCCTSLIFSDDQGRMIHFRTMDWDLDVLKDLTINLKVVNGLQPLYISTTWAGYIGAMTVMTVHGEPFTIAINYRRTPKRIENQPSIWNNVSNLFNKHWPVGYVIRYVAEHFNKFETAVNYLECARLISPAYFSICSPTVGCVITRSDKEQCSTNYVYPYKEHFRTKEPYYLVQTNIDTHDHPSDDNILWSRERIAYIRKEASNIVGRSWDEERVWSIMAEWPVLNNETIYGTIMIPCNAYFHSRIASENEWFFNFNSKAKQYCLGR